MLKETRSVEQVRRLLTHIGHRFDRIDPIPSEGRSRPDVRVTTHGAIVEIETTDFHGDEADQGGSATRRAESQHARHGIIQAYAVPIDPLPGIVKRVQQKTAKQYEREAGADLWLAIFGGVAEVGALAATTALSTFLTCDGLNAATHTLLAESPFTRCDFFSELNETGQPRSFVWTRETMWQRTA